MKVLGILMLLVCVFSTEVVAQTVERVYEAEITDIVDESINAYDQGQNFINQKIEVLLETGELKNSYKLIDYQTISGSDQQLYKVGDKVLVSHSSDPTGLNAFYIIDYQRKLPITRYVILFVGLVLLVARLKGLRSIVGLILSFVILFRLLLPWLQAGYDPIVSAIAASALIMLSSFYLTHGLNKKTTVAIVSTLIALMITGGISQLMVNEMKLTGYASEEANFLQYIKQGNLNIQGLLLAGIIISVVGILDDITISQASVVTELYRANPKLKKSQAFSQAMNVGQDHIASLVNTLILVYVGAALPLTMLFMLDETRSFGTIMSYSIVAEEIARTLAGSIALVLAVPITTVMAIRFLKNETSSTSKASHFHQH